MYYKVVNRTLDGLFSANSFYQIEYKIGEWTKPEFGKLFIFDDIERAKKFIKDELHDYFCIYPIFSCEVKNPTEYREKICILGRYYLIDGAIEFSSKESKESIENFWNGKDSITRTCPLGTFVCDELKLIEEIK